MPFKVFDASHTSIDVESTVNASGNHVPHHYREMSPSLLHGQGLAGAVATAISGSASVKSGITVRCLSGSPEPVYIGAVGVTPGTGYPIWPGTSSPKIEVNDLANLYIVSPTGAGTFAFVGT